MKKIRVNNLFIFLTGLVCLSLGVVLVIKSNLGVSVATSVPYVISLYFTNISFGQWNYIIHGSVLLILVAVVRRLTVKYLMSFIVAFLFGLSIDMFNTVFRTVQANSIIESLGLFAIGSVIISIGVASFIKSNYPILPFDTFVKEVCTEKNIPIAKFKTGFDLTCFTFSLTFCLIFFKGIRGLNVGTLASAFILGTMIGACLKFMNNHIEGQPLFAEDKTKPIFDFDLLHIKRSRELFRG